MTERDGAGGARIVVLSAPSGGGKTTIAKAVRDRHADRFGFSVSATTRKPRPDEREGDAYYFLTRKEFEQRRQRGEFLEWAEYAGNLYGTLKSEVNKVRQSGRHVLLDIEVEGARQVRALEPNALTIFVLPSDPRVLLERLVKRKSETLAELTKRLERAHHELEQSAVFDHWIRNDDLDQAVADVMRAVNGAGDARAPKDYQWMTEYGLGLQKHSKVLYDELHQQKG